MRNLTIVVEEEVARWARIKAAERDLSLSRLVGEMLRDRMAEDRSYEAAMRDYLSRRPAKLKRTGRYPSREALHERSGLR